MANLTICSVSYGCYRYLSLNWELSRALNADTGFEWILMDNAVGSREERVPQEDHRFSVYQGTPRGSESASWHHATALNSLVSLVSTRFLLVLDPDFYIVRGNWISDVLEHMKGRELSFFGAQWHPADYKKMRYFPSPHCMFIDLKRVSPDSLDFLPAGIWLTQSAKQKGPFGRYLKEILRRFDARLDISERAVIGKSRDTGYKIKEAFGEKPGFRAECIQAVFEPQKAGISGLVDNLLPDRLSFSPKTPHYTVDNGFLDTRSGLGPLRKRWEEFMWQGRPFGFHVRRYPSRKRGYYDRERNLRAIEESVNAAAGKHIRHETRGGDGRHDRSQ